MSRPGCGVSIPMGDGGAHVSPAKCMKALQDRTVVGSTVVSIADASSGCGSLTPTISVPVASCEDAAQACRVSQARMRRMHDVLSLDGSPRTPETGYAVVRPRQTGARLRDLRDAAGKLPGVRMSVVGQSLRAGRLTA